MANKPNLQSTRGNRVPRWITKFSSAHTQNGQLEDHKKIFELESLTAPLTLQLGWKGGMV